MPNIVPTTNSDRSTVTAASQQFSFSMAAGQMYVLTSSIACYILQGSNPTAAAADGSTYVAANESVLIYGGLGAKLAIIRAGSSDGEATLTRAMYAPSV